MPTRSAATTCRRPTSGRSCVFDLPELHYPDRLNCATALLDDVVAELGADRPCLRARIDHRGRTATCWHAPTGSRTCWSTISASCPATACCCAARTTRGWWRAGSACSRPARSPSPRCRCCAPASWPRSTRSPRLDARPVDHRFLDGTERSACRRRVVSATAPSWPPWRPAARDVRRRGDRRRRRRPARVHLRHDRAPEGDHALPPRRAGDLPTPSRATCCGPTADDVFTGTPPLAFTFGLGGLLLFPLHVGAPRRCWSRRPHPTSWPRSSPSTA